MFRDHIRENYERLTPGHRKLADFLVNHTLDAAFLTATEIARQVEVDPATVVRFAQELGYTGFRELSQEIKRYVHAQITSRHEPSPPEASLERRLTARFDDFQQNLQYFTAADFDRLGQMIAILNTAARIWIVAEDTSWDLAQAFARNLQNSGLSATAFYPNLLETAMRLHEMHAEDTLLAIGNEGPEVDIGYALRLAREKGVRTLCLSSNELQIAAREAELSLIAPCKKPSLAPGFAFIALLLVLIWEALADLHLRETMQHQEERRANIARLMALRAQEGQLDNTAPAIWAQQLSQTRHPPIL